MAHQKEYTKGAMCDGSFLESLEKQQFVRDSDVFIASPGKSGQTWLQVILRYFKSAKYSRDGKIEEGENVILEDSPWLENTMIPGTRQKYNLEERTKYLNEMVNPRVFKMHTGYKDIPLHEGANPKIICVVRNFLDVPFSFYSHFISMRNSFADMPWFVRSLILPVVGKLCGIHFPDLSSFDTFFEGFVDPRGIVSLQELTKHVDDLWQHRIDSNSNNNNSNNKNNNNNTSNNNNSEAQLPVVLFIRYEDMLTDLPNELKRIVNFLEWNWVTDEIINDVLPRVAFERMKEKETSLVGTNFQRPVPSGNGGFFREGRIGANRKHLSPEQTDQILSICRSNWSPELFDYVFNQSDNSSNNNGHNNNDNNNNQ